jgi:hypothetical protein
MPTKWQTVNQKLKERDMIRIHFDIPNELRHELRLAAAQDRIRMRDVYVQALNDYLRDRKIARSTDPKRSNKLKLDLKGLED